MTDHDQQVKRLGDALGARVRDVLARTVALGSKSAKGPRTSLDPAVIDNFERIGKNSTRALAAWMAGGNPLAGKHTGEQAWQTYGRLSAHSAAPLNEVTKRCLRWRDAVIEVLRDGAAELEVSAAALERALSMTQHVLDVTLVRICEVFEQERGRMANELTRRYEELAFMATHDQLTGLPNRTLACRTAKQAACTGVAAGLPPRRRRPPTHPQIQ
jgi:hypothetical protein